MSGNLIVVTGPMFAGKTTRLASFLDKKKIVVCHKTDEADEIVITLKNIKIFNNERDKERRGEEPAITTHSKKKIAAEWMGELEIEQFLRDGLAQLKDCNVIFIDEVQFFRKQTIIAFVEALQKENIHVCVAGLAQDSYGKAFGAMGELMAMADKIYLEKAKCTVCGAQATRTQRLVASEGVILVGGETMFAPRCTEHWNSLPVDN